MREQIERRLGEVDVEDTAALSEAAAEIRSLIESKPMPERLEEAIVAAYRELAGEERGIAVAVRSSATAEDTESASFAGMNETFLNVRGEAGVVDAVRRCWSSLFGARTVYYRARRGFGQADMDIAVVVQRQVDAIRAGVMFTVDPATGAPDRLVIEGSFGLGEAVVSGSVTPDRYVVDKATLELTKARDPHQGADDQADPRRRHGHPPAARGPGRPAGARRRGGAHDRRAGQAHRVSLRSPSGHRVGDRRPRQGVDAPVPPDHRRRERRPGRRGQRHALSRRRRGSPGTRPWRRSRRGERAGARDPRARGRRSARGRARSSSPT